MRRPSTALRHAVFLSRLWSVPAKRDARATCRRTHRHIHGTLSEEPVTQTRRIRPLLQGSVSVDMDLHAP
ncbi:hypothetical protein XA68_17732 [Ophiocordyceps unilateralis]|uniref:Uncharacterized protein n=1 Tax=Ophiocordyceps unilateralis TaxID=268505 RepID=A0A2A9P401_OPHUN|nr:hypothetical protein XA68_17732 [Ophiocordyceps unilateralis]